MGFMPRDQIGMKCGIVPANTGQTSRKAAVHPMQPSALVLALVADASGRTVALPRAAVVAVVDHPIHPVPPVIREAVGGVVIHDGEPLPCLRLSPTGLITVILQTGGHRLGVIVDQAQRFLAVVPRSTPLAMGGRPAPCPTPTPPPATGN
jgi:hypothetical protein